MIKNNIEEKIREKENRKLRNQIYRVIDEESKKFNIKKDYIWLKLFSSSDYTAVIKIVKNKTPVRDKTLLEKISYRLYRELGIKKVFYDFNHSRGKYQKLHYPKEA
ncbi:MAG: hypothetical protein N3G19_01680 [Candidatus Pacearchaeota archaeon]|nr:hypothetical protein [Candidatus Pacearchaeota archaeon]